MARILSVDDDGRPGPTSPFPSSWRRRRSPRRHRPGRAAAHRRSINGPHHLGALVRAEAVFRKGVLIESAEDQDTA